MCDVDRSLIFVVGYLIKKITTIFINIIVSWFLSCLESFKLFKMPTFQKSTWKNPKNPKISKKLAPGNFCPLKNDIKLFFLNPHFKLPLRKKMKAKLPLEKLDSWAILLMHPVF